MTKKKAQTKIAIKGPTVSRKKPSVRKAVKIKKNKASKHNERKYTKQDYLSYISSYLKTLNTAQSDEVAFKLRRLVCLMAEYIIFKESGCSKHR